jgi:hypothetical protein
MKQICLIIIVFLSFQILGFCPNLYCQDSNLKNNVINSVGLKNSVAIKPIDLFVSIYAIQYERQITKNSEIVFGLYYIGNNNNKYPGTYKLYSPMIGYRRYFWKGLHMEYMMLPGYGRYNDSIMEKNYNSFEIWNELHIGYRFDFKICRIPFCISPQVLAGFCLYRSNQPQNFKLVDDKPENYFPNKLYIFPNVNLGIRF